MDKQYAHFDKTDEIIATVGLLTPVKQGARQTASKPRTVLVSDPCPRTGKVGVEHGISVLPVPSWENAKSVPHRNVEIVPSCS
ncbi:MAG: hypothetical protein QXS54_01885 [Candidatus Methanomethylicaceae archaeon]